MKKEFKLPTIELVELLKEDIITASGIQDGSSVVKVDAESILELSEGDSGYYKWNW